MELYHIRDLINVEPDDFLTQYPPKFDIEFDDGDILTVTRKRTYVTAFFWRIFRDFPQVTILKNCHISHVLGPRLLETSSHGKLATNICQAVIEKVGFLTQNERETLQFHVQTATNDLYNGLLIKSGRHLQSIHLMDCIELMYHPEIVDGVKTMPATPSGVENLYKTIQKVIETDQRLENNGVVKAVLSKTVKLNQICQSVGIRGFPKEVNGRIFREIAYSNYLFGMINLYEFAADSRSSAEHLNAAESPLQDSEFFSRRLQIQTCVLEEIEESDCGTRKTSPWFVKPSGYNEATGEYRKSDLTFMVGKMYVDHKGELQTIKATDKHLEGTTIQLRTVQSCQTPDPHKVCQVCFGKLANNHSSYYNLGVSASLTMVSRISQRTLGTKHHIASGAGTGVTLTNELRKFFKRGPKNTDYVLIPEFMETKPTVVVHRDDALGLIDVINSSMINYLNRERITGFSKIRFIYTDPVSGSEQSDEVSMSTDKRYASFSDKLLDYVKAHGFETDARNNFVIDLKHWNREDVIFTLPDIQMSFSAYGNDIARVIESSFDNLAERQSEDAPLKVLGKIFDMVTLKMDIPLATLEAIVYGLMQASPHNLSLGRLSDKPVMGIGKSLIWKRSFGTAMAFQQWDHLFLDPRSYYAKNKPSTIMDVFYDPKGYLTHHSKTYVNGIHYKRQKMSC